MGALQYDGLEDCQGAERSRFVCMLNQPLIHPKLGSL